MAQIVMTANAFVWSFICMPHTPQDDAAAKRVQKSPSHLQFLVPALAQHAFACCKAGTLVKPS
jgi:hypothetical protein